MKLIPEEETELIERLESLPEFQHIDLWHDQVNYLSEEHPFPTPAVFLEFNTLKVDDNGELIQTTDLQVDMHVYWETFSDTYTHAVMQEDGLQFLDLLLLVGLMFHGRSGEHYHQMRRSGTYREESGGAGNLYRIQFQTNISEFSGLNLHDRTSTPNKDLEIVGKEKGWKQGESLYSL